jgi:ABC-type multidrug transport system fused ATPase/permease subunit
VLAVAVILAPLLVHYPTLETRMLTFGLLTVAFYLLLGELGFLSFGQATFNGIGAYVTARALLDGHAPLLMALAGGTAAGALGAALIGALAIRGRGVYGVMLTFAFNEMAYYIAFQWRSVTGGDNGLGGLPERRRRFAPMPTSARPISGSAADARAERRARVVRRKRVLHGVLLTVPEGQVAALLGRNGAGKSTTLKTIMGLVTPRAGSIHFDGTEIGGKT